MAGGYGLASTSAAAPTAMPPTSLASTSGGAPMLDKYQTPPSVDAAHDVEAAALAVRYGLVELPRQVPHRMSSCPAAQSPGR